MKKGLIITIIIVVISGAVLGSFFYWYKIRPKPQEIGVVELPRFENLSQYIQGEVVIKFKENVTQEQINEFENEFGLEIIRNNKVLGFIRYSITTDKKVDEIIDLLRGHQYVDILEPNFVKTINFIPNDSYYHLLWSLHGTGGGINVEDAWDESTGNNVVVAVLDSGVAYENYGSYRIAPDYENVKFWVNEHETPNDGLDNDGNGFIDDINGWDFVNYDNHPNDDYQHGTAITSIIAESINNNQGSAGIAYDAVIMPVKVLPADGKGTSADVADGIVYAAENGADIINLSLGGEDGGAYEQAAVDYAYSQGVTIFAATGNDYLYISHYPASFDNVIAVGATRYDRQKSAYSNSSDEIDIVAPGGDLSLDQNLDGRPDGILVVTILKNQPSIFGYFWYSGTSSATPHAAAVAAMMKAKNPSLTPDEIEIIMETTAEDRGAPGWDVQYGHGLIDAYAAVSAVDDPLCGDSVIEGDEVCDGANHNGETCFTQGHTAGTLTCLVDCLGFDASACTDCGNNDAEVGETCDGIDLRSQDCTDFSYVLGDLACDVDCTTYDTLGCLDAPPNVCGDGVVAGDEDCDGSDFRGQTCESMSYDGGTLLCNGDCTYNFDSCEEYVCGDGIIEGAEFCDSHDVGGVDCVDLFYDFGILTCLDDCNWYDVAGCGDFECGNNVAESTETCDGIDLDGETCITQGHTGGDLYCDNNCLNYESSSCTDDDPTVCGDNIAEGDEVCDGTDLATQTCANFSYDTGTLACRADCEGYEIAGCYDYVCGNGVQEGIEFCDGSDFGGQTCVGLGYDDGTLICPPGCVGYDESNCIEWICGNNITEGTETCDGSDVGTETCISQGHTDGSLTCLVDCSGYETANCTLCGNNTIESGEICDGSDLNGQDCTDFEYLGGTLACLVGCSDYNKAACTSPPAQECLNNIAEGTEQCDGSDLNEQDCISLSHDGGVLSCDIDCTYDVSGCETWVCGNDNIEGSEDCDGTNLNGTSCINLGYNGGLNGGTLACWADCSFNVTDCFNSGCGNNVIESEEECDMLDIGGDTCQSLGYESGVLGCLEGCRFDTSNCFSGLGEELDEEEDLSIAGMEGEAFGMGFMRVVGLGTTELPAATMNIVNVIMGFLGVLAISVVLWGGFRWMVAGGSADKVDEAKKILVTGVVGLFIVLIAYSLTMFVIVKIVEATM